MTMRGIHTKWMCMVMAGFSTLVLGGMVPATTAQAASYSVYGMIAEGTKIPTAGNVSKNPAAFRVLSLSYGVQDSATSLKAGMSTRESGSANPILQPIVLVKSVDGNSAHLWYESLSGLPVSGVIVVQEMLQNEAVTVMELQFQGTITSDQQTVSDGSAPQEEIIISRASETLTITPIRSDGVPGKPVTVKYDTNSRQYVVQ